MATLVAAALSPRVAAEAAADGAALSFGDCAGRSPPTSDESGAGNGGTGGTGGRTASADAASVTPATASARRAAVGRAIAAREAVRKTFVGGLLLVGAWCLRRGSCPKKLALLLSESFSSF